jgi:YbgC/YbaW family acyl-CoA thioester hydrolase
MKKETSVVDFSRPAHAYCRQVEPLRVGQFDMGGVLHHANYYHIFEAAKEALMAEHGYPYTELVENGHHLPLVEAHQHFLKPVNYGDPLRIYVWITELSRASVRFCYEIVTEKLLKNSSPGAEGNPQPIPTTIHIAWTKHVFVLESGTGFKVSRIPERLMHVFELFSIGPLQKL